MPPIRVDFYLIPTSEPHSQKLFACRLLEKAYVRGHRVFVYCNDQQQAELIDELLWTFKEESFIPHNLQGEGLTPPPAVQIGYKDEPIGYQDILLNLADEIPKFFSQFRRVMEVVVNDELAKNLSRLHYREYRNHQCELHTHNIEQ